MVAKKLEDSFVIVDLREVVEKKNNYEPSLCVSLHRLLRRTLVRLIRCAS
jgi:hypothetical protein